MSLSNGRELLMPREQYAARYDYRSEEHLKNGGGGLWELRMCGGRQKQGGDGDGDGGGGPDESAGAGKC